MDDATQSTFGECLSQISINSSLDQFREKQVKCSFRKNGWLKDYFSHEKRNGDTFAKCLGCGQLFRSRSHDRMKIHLKKCKKSGIDGDMSRILHDPETTNSITTNLFTRALIEAGWTLRGIETEGFKRFIARLTTSWTIPSRQEISGIHIPRLSLQLQKKFLESLNTIAKTSLSIEFDHWEDATHKSLLGVIATCNNGKRHLIDLRDVSLRSHEAKVTVEEIVDALKSVPNTSINSVVSDSASTCKKARSMIVERPEFKHVIQHRCLAHFMNLVGSRLTNKSQLIAETMKKVSKIVGFISGSTFWSNYIKSQQHNSVRAACPVRWYSACLMLIAIMDLRGVIMEEIRPNLDREKKQLIDSLDWNHVEEILEEVEPLSQCIGQLEKKDCSLGEGVRQILQYARKLFDEQSVSNTGSCALLRVTGAKNGARKAFLHYFNEAYLGQVELSLYIAAYALDRRYKLDYLTPKGLELCLRAVSRIATKTGATLDQIKASIPLEFEYYKVFKNEYQMTNIGPAEWWSERINGGLLCRVGQRLSHLKASTANIERTFSSLKSIQGENRLNLSRDSLVHIARVKISFGEARDETLDERDELSDVILDENNQCGLQDESLVSNTSSEFVIEEDCSSWIEDQDVETKFSYQSFCRYFNFSIINEPTEDNDRVMEVTEEEIRGCVRYMLGKSGDDECVIVDTQSQMDNLDAMSIADTDDMSGSTLLDDIAK